MSTPYELDEHYPGDGCVDGHDDESGEFWGDYDDEIYDDPYEVVMYDIDTEPDDLYALIDMLSDSARSWYARRRLNALSAAGPLSALVADGVIDSLGRRWNPLQHPRDRFGKFIETGGFIRWMMKGEWLRGQISRIDSDGVIHVRSHGNDHIPDGTSVRFKPELASKLISIENPIADLSNIHVPSPHSIPGIDEPNINEPGPNLPDIPDFPEASDTQKRIYDALKNGDLPAEDLDAFRSPDDADMPAEDFAGQLVDLESRGLIEIDRSGDRPRVRRTDGGDGDVVDVDPNEIDDIPDDETPDIADSPALTKAQRDLLDRLVDADSGENDGVRQDELSDVDGDDFQALIDAGVLTPGDDGNYFLANPEGDNADGADVVAETDLSDEIAKAAADRLDDPFAQEAFQHYAEELARPGDENNAELPEGLAPAKRRNAEAAANKWWEERNADTPAESDQADVPEGDQPNPKDVLNPRNQAMADQLMAEYFPDEDFDNYLDSDEGIDYRGAIKRLFDAEDLEENGFDVQAGVERDKANQAMERVGVSPEDIEGWPIEVQNVRNAGREQDAPDVADDVAPEDVVPDVQEEPAVPSADVPEPDVPVDATPDSGVDLVNEPGAPQNEQERINEEVRQNLINGAREPDALAQNKNNPWRVTGRNGFVPEDLPILDNAEDWDVEERSVAAHEVAQAMWDAQINYIIPDAAYEVAAEHVRSGDLDQADLDRIQDAVKEYIEGRGQKWDANREIDHVGDDQAPDVRQAPDVVPNAPNVADLVPVAASPEHEKVVNQPGLDFVDTSNLSDDGFALDKNGQRVQVGNWYRADAGGEGDPGKMVGFYDQEKYPGLIALVMPDGKVKGVFAKGQNRITPKEANEWRAQRAVRNREQATVGQGMPELDQFHRMLKIKDPNDPNGPPVQAKLGMRVVSNSGGQKFPRGEEGVIVRFGWDGAKGRPIIFVVRPGAQGQRDEIGLAPKAVQFKADTPIPTPREVTPDRPNFNTGDLPDREWAVPTDAELLEHMHEMGDEVDMVKFVNAFVNPGVVHDQIKYLADNGQLEIVPGGDDLRPRIRVPGGNAGTPALPDGAEDEFEGAVLNAIDAAGDGGLRKADIVSLDDDSAGEKLVALRALAERGVLRERTDPDGGRPFFERVVQTPEPTKVDGAENVLEADLLNIIDGNDGGVGGADLVDIDADDAADRMLALRALVDRGVVRREVGEDGKPTYRRRVAGSSSTPKSMSDAEAADALRGGEDPLMVANERLDAALRAAGYRFVANGEARAAHAISPNDWVIAPQDGEFPVDLRGHGPQKGKVFMVKRSSGIPDDILNEVMAGAISEDLREELGRDATGLLFHPRVGLAEAPHGVGYGAGGAVIMDHAAYGFPEGHQFFSGADLDDTDLQRGGASADIIGLGLYDYLINNTVDRHRNNQMFVKDPQTGDIRAVIIDNGFGFGAGANHANPNNFAEYARNGRPAALLRRADRRNRADVEKAVNDFVSAYGQMDIDSIMTRIKAAHPTMTPDQEAYVRTWLTTAKTRVDKMALDIDSVVDTIMGL